MVKINISYSGTLSFDAVHEPSGSKITTDAPVDNQGLGRTFSPTDLLATSLGTCVGTLMAIYAERHDLDLTGLTISLEKHMQADPRRVGHLPLQIDMPIALNDRHRQGIETAAAHCPVKKSLHPDIKVDLIFSYPG